MVRDLAHESVRGLSLLGGEPFLNTGVCLALAWRARDEFGSAKDVWAWSGYRFDELLAAGEDKLELLSLVDVLVDGPYLARERDLSLQFRGSRNQRVLDVKESLAARTTIERCV